MGSGAEQKKGEEVMRYLLAHAQHGHRSMQTLIAPPAAAASVRDHYHSVPYVHATAETEQPRLGKGENKL